MSREKSRHETRFFDFDVDPPVGYTEMMKTVDAALDDEGLTRLVGNTADRPTVVRMHLKDWGRVMDRLVLPGSRITEKLQGVIL